MKRLVAADDNEDAEQFDPWVTFVQFRRWKESHSWLKKMMLRLEMANALDRDIAATPSLQSLSVSSLGSESSSFSTSDMIKQFLEREQCDAMMSQLFGRQTAAHQTDSSTTAQGRNRVEQGRAAGAKPGNATTRLPNAVQFVDAKLVKAYPSRTFQNGDHTAVKIPTHAECDNRPVYIFCVNDPNEHLEAIGVEQQPQKPVSKKGRSNKKK